MRKFIEFLEVAALMILVAVLTVGVINYTKTIDSEDPIDETPLEDEIEVLSLTLIHKRPEDNGGNIYFTINYEEGMTWLEWAESEYSSDISIDMKYEYVCIKHSDAGELTLVGSNAGEPVSWDSVIDSTNDYFLG